MRPRIRSEIADELIETGTFSTFKVIDTHGHMGPYRAIYFPRDTPELMVGTMNRCGVEWLVFAHHDALQHPVRGNRAAQEAIDAFPDRFLGYYAVNPRYPDLLRKAVNEFSSLRGFAGYKILATTYGVPITRPVFEPLWAHANDEKLAVLVHTWQDDPCASWQHVHEVAGRYPEARLLMGHSCYGAWDEAIRMAREHAHVYCELTAAYAVNGVVKKMVDEGIEDKITFGTDLPWFDPMCGIGCVVFADIGDPARRKILRDNAERIFARWLGRSGRQ